MTRNVSRILLAENSLKLSAQSPPCTKNALRSVALASSAFKLLHSPANTNGGKVFNRPIILSSFS